MTQEKYTNLYTAQSNQRQSEKKTAITVKKCARKFHRMKNDCEYISCCFSRLSLQLQTDDILKMLSLYMHIGIVNSGKIVQNVYERFGCRCCCCCSVVRMCNAHRLCHHSNDGEQITIYKCHMLEYKIGRQRKRKPKGTYVIIKHHPIQIWIDLRFAWVRYLIYGKTYAAVTARHFSRG